MNNFIIAAKRFLQNKNTVTILGVLGIILILFFGYRYQINKMVNPVSNIPVAATTIQPKTQITSDMVEYISVAPVVLQSNVLTNRNDVIGKYSNYNTVIPQGSLFYKEAVVNESSLPDSAFIELADGEVPYNFPVTMETTYGNSIYPNNYIDIYMKAQNEDGQLMVGKLIENVKVLAVKDAQGRHVFEDSSDDRTPSTLIFGLDPELNILLRKASYMSAFSTILFPVPHGAGVTVSAAEGETAVSSQTLKDFINANTVPNDELQTNTDNTDTEKETKKNSKKES